MIAERRFVELLGFTYRPCAGMGVLFLRERDAAVI